MNRNYTVFISHAGPDKLTVAIPLYERLRERNIHAFLDRHELRAGDNGPRVMEYAMKTAPVGVFILSPEFPARAWTMTELMCFQEREQDAIAQGLPLPRIIPVFYRLALRDCRDSSVFYKKNDKGESVFFENKFFERVLQGKITMQQVVDSLRLLSLRTGIENTGIANNEDTVEMKQKRDHLVELIVDAVEFALQQIDSSAEDDAVRYWRNVHQTLSGGHASQQSGSSENPHLDLFVPHFEVWHNPRYVSLLMDQVADAKAPLSSEAKVKKYLLEGNAECPVVVVQGMPGVGKTCTLRAICHDADIRARYAHGVYVISLGADATLQTFGQGIWRAIRSSGGHKLESELKTSSSFEGKIEAAMKWFSARTCLFLLDDVWSSCGNGAKCIEWLSRVVIAGHRSAMVVSTREKALLMHKSISRRVTLRSHKPHSPSSRRILLQSAAHNSELLLSDSAEPALKSMLHKCGGLPVALAVTGRAIGRLALDMEQDFDRAIKAYSKFQSDGEYSVLDDYVDDYTNLSLALSTSLRILGESSYPRTASSFYYSYKEMHRALCILEKQQWMPLTVLRRLWKLSSTEIVDIAVRRFSDVGLLDVHYRNVRETEVKGVRMHDLVHDFAIQEAKTAGEVEHWHSRLLQGYHLAEVDDLAREDFCRPWWNTPGKIDSYPEENVIRHLIWSGNSREALVLLGRPQWIVRKLQACGILMMERDFHLVQHHLLSSPTSTPITDPQGMARDLSLLLNAIRLGALAILENPREVHFQLCARLISGKYSSPYIRNVVKYAEENASKPFPSPVTSCVHTAERFQGQIISCKGVTCVRVMENNSIIIAGKRDGSIEIFDFNTGERKMQWKPHNRGVQELITTKDSKFLISRSGDKTVRSFDTTDDFREVSFWSFSSEVWAMVSMPNCNSIVAGSMDGTISLLALRSGECLGSWASGQRVILNLAVSSDGGMIASGSLHNGFAVFRIEEGNKLAPFVSLDCRSPQVGALCFTPDRKRLISVSKNTFKIWDVAQAQNLGEFSGAHSGQISWLSTSEDGERIFSAGTDGTARIWSEEGHLEFDGQFADYGENIKDVQILQYLDQVIWCEQDAIRMAYLQDLEKVESQAAKHVGEVEGLCMTLDGTLAVSGGRDGDLIVWDTVTGLQVGRTLSGHSSAVRFVSVTPDGGKIVSVSYDGKVVLWDLQSQEQLSVLIGHEHTVESLRISMDGKYAITGSKDGTVRIWDLTKNGAEHKVLDNHGDWVLNIYLAQNAEQFVSLSRTMACLWDLQSLELVKVGRVEGICWFQVKDIETVIGVSFISPTECRLGSGYLERDPYWRNLKYRTDKAEVTLATMDALMWRLVYSPLTNRLCVGLGSGHVSMLRIDKETEEEIS